MKCAFFDCAMRHNFFWAVLTVGGVVLGGCEASDSEPADGVGGQPTDDSEAQLGSHAGASGSAGATVVEDDSNDQALSTAGAGGAETGESNDCPDELPSGPCQSDDTFSCTGWVQPFVEVYCSCPSGIWSCAM